MTIEDIREYKKNAVEILRKHDQYATAKAVEEAFGTMICIGQFMWERDVAISQLEELGLSLGQKVDHVKEAIEKSIPMKPNEVKGIYEITKPVCPRCGNDLLGEYCCECGQRIDV